MTPHQASVRMPLCHLPSVILPFPLLRAMPQRVTHAAPEFTRHSPLEATGYYSNGHSPVKTSVAGPVMKTGD